MEKGTDNPVRRARQKLRLSQAEFARRHNHSQVYISQMERGLRGVPLHIVADCIAVGEGEITLADFLALPRSGETVSASPEATQSRGVS